MLSQDHRLRTSAEFGYALRSGSRFGSRNLVVFLADLPDPQKPTIVGFLVSKKVGNAVVRNKVKRRLREEAAEFVRSCPQGKAMVVRALPPAAALPFAELASDFRRMVAGCIAKGARRRP